MIFILCAVLLTQQALSLPPLQKRYDVLNPSNSYRSIFNQSLTSLIELGARKPPYYRILIEASSTKVWQCFYYIKGTGPLKKQCVKKTDKPIEDCDDKELSELITHKTKALTDLLSAELNCNEETKNCSDISVPVDIMATAGMRKLDIEKQTNIWSKFIQLWEEHREKKIKENQLEQKKKKKKKKSIWQLLQLNSIQDTSGVEEGIYGCMIANVALGYLDLELNLKKEAVNMVGIVEIGGASAQIAAPTTKKTTHFNNFKDFHSRSIPFGTQYFWTDVMEKEMPKDCQFHYFDGHYGSAYFDGCYSYVSTKIQAKADKVEQTVLPLPEEILKFSHYYLLGGTFGYAWSGKGQQIVDIGVLKDWTEDVCAEGAQWLEPPEKNGFAEKACYSSVYAYSFLEHFLGDKNFHIGKPRSKENKYLESSEYVDWPSAAYMYLHSNDYDRPSTEASVTVIDDNQYEKIAHKH